MYIFELCRKARLVQQRRGGGARGAGFSSITQRDFDIGLLYIFLLVEIFGRRILYILYMGWGGAVSWTVTKGPYEAVSSHLFIAKQRKLFSVLGVVSWRRNRECNTESGISQGGDEGTLVVSGVKEKDSERKTV